jgi:PRTRC genetic system ThiF family protein
MNTLKKMHFADSYLINPTNPITVSLIGAGGTGSRMLTELARMNHSLISLGHTGLQVTLYDDDTITPANQGRQLFADAEVGLFKSVALINRTNRFFGTSWRAVPEQFNAHNLKSLPSHGRTNIYISCVDTISARFEIAQILKDLNDSHTYQRSKALYWLDIGNAQNTGQAVLSTIGEIKQPDSKLYSTVSSLAMITDEFEEILKQQSDTNQPSCSLAEALEKQDLFINSSLASMGASLLWKLFREGMTPYRGFFFSLADYRAEPIKAG